MFATKQQLSPERVEEIFHALTSELVFKIITTLDFTMSQRKTRIDVCVLLFKRLSRQRKSMELYKQFFDQEHYRALQTDKGKEYPLPTGSGKIY